MKLTTATYRYKQNKNNRLIATSSGFKIDLYYMITILTFCPRLHVNHAELTCIVTNETFSPELFDDSE
jgi:hypothetical protein